MTSIIGRPCIEAPKLSRVHAGVRVRSFYTVPQSREFRLALQSLNLSLNLLWVLLAHHVLLVEAVVVQVVGVVEKVAGFVFLLRGNNQLALGLRCRVSSQGTARTSSYSSRRRLPRQEEQLPMTSCGVRIARSSAAKKTEATLSQSSNE